MLRCALDAGDEVRILRHEVQQPDALESLHHRAHAAVGHAGHLVDRARRADAVHVLGGNHAVGPGLALRREDQQPVAAHDVVDDSNRRRIHHEQRHCRQWEHHAVRQREDRQGIGKRELGRAAGGWRRHRGGCQARFGSVMCSSPRS